MYACSSVSRADSGMSFQGTGLVQYNRCEPGDVPPARAVLSLPRKPSRSRECNACASACGSTGEHARDHLGLRFSPGHCSRETTLQHATRACTANCAARGRLNHAKSMGKAAATAGTTCRAAWKSLPKARKDLWPLVTGAYATDATLAVLARA